MKRPTLKLLIIGLCFSILSLSSFAINPSAESYEADMALTISSGEPAIIKSGVCGALGDGSNLTWTLDSNGLLSISGQGEMTNLNELKPFKDKVISIVIEPGVTTIADYAFDGCVNMTNITIPDSVTYIGENALFNCSSLTSLSIPDSVTTIGGDAFAYCNALTNVTLSNNLSCIACAIFHYCTNLTSVTIPDGVTKIEGLAFENCSSLKSIAIPGTVTSIELEAFYSCCNLTSVIIPGSVTNIDLTAFCGCENLISFEVSQDNLFYSSLDGILYDREKTTLIKCPEGKSGGVDIPNGVAKIEYNAFSYCHNVTSITIPDSVTDIDCAFSYCDSLMCIDVSTKNQYYASLDGLLYSKDESTLLACPAGKVGHLTIPDNVTTIDYGSFFGCNKLTDIAIPGNTTSINRAAFTGCSCLRWIGVSTENPIYSSLDGILYNVDQSIIILCPEGKTGIVDIPNGVKSISQYAFFHCHDITGINIPSSVISIEMDAFAYCSSLTGVSIPSGISAINADVFAGCDNLASIAIPNSVTYISGSAFDDSPITDIYYTGSEIQWNAIERYGSSDEVNSAHIHYMDVCPEPSDDTQQAFSDESPTNVESLVQHLVNWIGNIIESD